MLPPGTPVEVLPSKAPSLGTISINLQQTAQDGKMSLRFFGKSDDVLRLLLKELGLNPAKAKAPVWPKTSRVLVPYDAEGRRLTDDSAKRMWLDLTDGQK